MPRIIQCGELRAINKTSTADFTCAVDGGVELGPGSQITLERAFVHKPGADLEETAGSITLEEDVGIFVKAYVGMVASSFPGVLDGLSATQGDFNRYYATQTELDGSEGVLESLNIPISIPAGTYRPSNLCALISDQTRLPTSLEDVPYGSVLCPSTKLLKGGSQNPYITYTASVEDIFSDASKIDDYPLPLPARVVTNLSPATQIKVLYYNNVLKKHFEVSATMSTIDGNTGIFTSSFSPSLSGLNPGDTYQIKVQSANHLYYLRTDEGVTTNQIIPQGSQGVLARELFGCTTGISFTYDTVTGRVQMSAHSPYYNNPSGGGAGPVSVGIGTDASGKAFHSGTGPRGFLGFPKDAWGGLTEDTWEGSVFEKLGFRYEDLNGSTDHTDTSGFIVTDAYFDGAFDVYQSNQNMGVPLFLQSERSDGPEGQVLTLAPGALETPLWLIRVSILPNSDENRWVSPDGSDTSGILGTVSKQYASGDFYTSEGGPIWTLSKKQKPFTVGSIRVQILDGLSLIPDESIGEGTTIILNVM